MNHISRHLYSKARLKVSTLDSYWADLMTVNENIWINNFHCCGFTRRNEAIGAFLSTIRRRDYPTLPNTQRFSSVIHEMYGCKWGDSVSGCVLGAYRGGEGRVKVRWRSFLHLHLPHFTTLLFRQYNHFNNCLPSSAPHPLLLLFLLTRKMMYLQAGLQHFSALLFPTQLWKSPIGAGTAVPLQVLNRCKFWKSNVLFCSFRQMLIFYLHFSLIRGDLQNY